MISEAEAFMSSGYTQTLGAEPGQRKADIYVPIGEQSLGFEWHTATVTQTEIIMPMEEPLLGFERHTITATPKGGHYVGAGTFYPNGTSFSGTHSRFNRG